MRITIPHRFRFGSDRALLGRELAGEAAWDALRLRTQGSFALPGSRDEWERLAADPAIVARARAIRDLVPDRSLASYGVGTGTTELALARLDAGRRIVMTEFAPGTVERLRSLFTEGEVFEHDLRADPPVAGIDTHLFIRIDTELDDAAFEEVLRRFRSERMLILATEVLGPRAVVRELATLLRGATTRAGHVRSRGAFEALWRGTHDARRVVVADLNGWLLTPRA